jgi:hypothetical protein
MFKRGPDGQMRQALQGGGPLAALGLLYKGAKFAAPKFTNLPYNINRMLAKRGIPTITGKKRTTGIQPPWVGKEGPMDYSPIVNPRATYDWRMKAWTDKYDALRGKHGIGSLRASGALGTKHLPEEVIQHWKTHPKMGWQKSLTEQGLYGLTGSTLARWANDPDDPYSNIKEETGSMDDENLTPTEEFNEQQETGQTEGPIASGIIPEGPKKPGTNIPDNSISNETGDEYDGTRQPGLFGSDVLPDITSEATAADESISLDGIDKYKKELRELIGKEDKTMGPLMLMQLGLGMMAGKSMQPGFAGFAEILGKTGQQVLPMWMEHMRDKRKEDKEIALAAYEMLREDRASKAKRSQDLIDYALKEEMKMNTFIKKEEYKQPYAGDESMIQINNPFFAPNGDRIDNWSNYKQTYSKSPEAMLIHNGELGGPDKIRVINLNMTEAGLKAAGFGDMSLTQAQRGQESLLANTYKSNLNQIFNFIMDPEIGVHSGQFHTGPTGWFVGTARVASREALHFFNTFFPKSKIGKAAANGTATMFGALRTATDKTISDLAGSTMGLLPGEGNQEGEHKGSNDVIHGTYDGVTGDFATEQYVNNLMDNQFYDVKDQMINMMGFLEARLKQPTGRLLADTIKSSINNLKSDVWLQSGDPVMYSNKLHQFVRRLYDAYARHSMSAGNKPETSFGVGRLGQELTVEGYNKSYLNFAGSEAIDQGIDLGFMDQFPATQQNVQGNIYPGKKEVVITAPGDFGELLKMYGGG